MEKINVTDVIIEGIKACGFLTDQVKEHAVASLNQLNREYYEAKEKGALLHWRLKRIFTPEIDLKEFEKKGKDIVHWAFLDSILLWGNESFPYLDKGENFAFWRHVSTAMIAETRRPDYEPECE